MRWPHPVESQRLEDRGRRAAAKPITFLTDSSLEGYVALTAKAAMLVSARGLEPRTY